MGFARTVVTDPEHHDEMIAFTSQIAHVLACSYVLSPLAPQHAGYSAGSYRDVSRVARINADMWTELFIFLHLAPSNPSDHLLLKSTC